MPSAGPRGRAGSCGLLCRGLDAELLGAAEGDVGAEGEVLALGQVEEFFDTWERTIRDLIERYVTPLVSESERQFHIDLLRVVQNGVVLSSVEHPKYWTPEKQIEFIDALVPVIERLSAGPEERN